MPSARREFYRLFEKYTREYAEKNRSCDFFTYIVRDRLRIYFNGQELCPLTFVCLAKAGINHTKTHFQEAATDLEINLSRDDAISIAHAADNYHESVWFNKRTREALIGRALLDKFGPNNQ